MQILCATDFSKPAKAAADVAAVLAKKWNLLLRLVHCGPEYLVMGELPVVEPDDGPANAQLDAEAGRLRAAAGIEVTTELLHGVASLEIIAATAAQPTQMIVLGSVGKGVAARWLIGSVAERVAEGAPVPTLVVREPEPLLEWLCNDGSLWILCGVDMTPSADAAIQAMQSFVSLGRVEVEGAFVRPDDDPVITAEALPTRQRDVWERLRVALGDKPVKVHVCDAVGLPANEFLCLAEQQKAGLLVVGTHQRQGWQRLKNPSFSRSTLAHAHTNVFCVPATQGPDRRIPTIRCVLLATDFEEVCTEALRHAHSLLPSGGTIHMVNVVQEPSRGINPIIASQVFFDQGMASAKAREVAEASFKALPAELMAVPGVTVDSEVLTHHDVVAAICDAAERIGADVICMGTKGHSRTGVALLGSTVQAVLARVHKPVFIVTPPVR